jgi:F0F1-type ATP synthase delta subunit
MVSQIDLSQFFITKSQATDFMRSLDSIIDQLYEVNFDINKTLADEFGIEKRDKFMELLRDSKMTNASNDTLKALLQNMQETVKKLPILSLSIAFEPTEAVLKSFLEWCLFTLNRQVIIDLEVDRNLIAGATINFNGKFKDYSIKPLLTEIIKREVYKTADISAQQNTSQTQ